MPNHVINKVTISGKKSDIAKCKKQIITTTEKCELDFSFQSIIPMPEELNIKSGSDLHWGLEYVKSGYKELPSYMNGMTEEEMNECIELGKKALSNIEKYGHKDWYDWRVCNWGTKWDCYDLSVDVTETSILLEFSTAWNTPKPIFEKLAELYPTLEIEVLYADEDLGNNCGSYSFYDEEWTEEDGDYEFACELWGYDPEDEEEEDGD